MDAWDPTGEKARAVKARYQGVCRGCGAPTAAAGRQGRRVRVLQACHPGAIAATWTRERVRDAMRTWQARYGSPPSSTTGLAPRATAGREASKRWRDRRMARAVDGHRLYASWAAARSDAFPQRANRKCAGGACAAPARYLAGQGWPSTSRRATTRGTA